MTPVVGLNMSLLKSAQRQKKQVIELCLENDVNFIVHIVHHDIIKNQAESERIWGGANYVIGRFNFFLRDKEDNGICLLDNFETSSQYKYIAEKFQRGLVTPWGDRRLDRIQLLGTTCVNASHANSAMDIVLGSFRFCINNPKNIDAASDMMPQLVKMLWTTKIGSRVKYTGFILRPELSKVETDYKFVKKDYDELLNHIDSLCPGI